MKINKLILLFLSFFLISWYPFIIKETLKERNLKGPVKMIIENGVNWQERNIFVQYFKRGKLVRKRLFKPRYEKERDSLFPELEYSVSVNPYYQGVDTNEFEFYYDESIIYSPTNKKLYEYGRFSDGMLNRKKIYTYDEKDSLLSVLSYGFNYEKDSLPILISKVSCTNEKNKITKRYRNFFNTRNIKEIYFNTLHQPILKVEKEYSSFQGKERNSKRTYLYFYDKRNRLIWEKRVFFNTSQLYQTTIFNTRYTYDRRGNATIISDSCWVEGSFEWSSSIKKYYKRSILRESQSDSNDDVLSTIYNDKGDIVKEFYLDRSESTKRFEYKYDKYNNWIEKIEFSNDVSIDTITRKIFYYE